MDCAADFAVGITDELISALGQIPGVQVAGRTSVFALRDPGLDSKAIGARLNAATLLEGSVQRAGSSLRVTAQIIDAATGRVLWSDIYRRDVKDMLDVEEEISRGIVAALRLQLNGGGRPLVRHGTENTDAHDLYLKGRYFWNQRTKVGLAKGIECFEQAIAVDPTSAVAHAGLVAAGLDGWTWLVDLPAAALTLWLAFRWGLVQSLRIELATGARTAQSRSRLRATSTAARAWSNCASASET